MLNVTTTDTCQARHNAVAATEVHLRRHGGGLCDLLDTFDDQCGFSALCDLQGILNRALPDSSEVEAALCAIHRILADQPPSSLDRIARGRNLSAVEMTQWHGARISELLARFRYAE